MYYDAEIIDQVQQLFRVNRCNDHQLHCVLKFEFGADANLLKKAFTSSIKAVPILGTRYIGGLKPHWERVDSNNFNGSFVIVRTEAEFEEFILSRIDETVGPQVRLCLHNVTPVAIAIKMNHMVCDAAGFKEFLYFLCKIYSKMLVDPGYRPALVAGNRGMRGVLKCFGMGAKLRSLLSKSEEKTSASKGPFPLSQVGEVQPFILTRKLRRERVAAIKNYGRARRATLNDVVLAAYYRCLFHILALGPAARLEIPVTVDMRRYLKENNEFEFLTNLSSSVIIRLEYKPEENFENTLSRIKAIMDENKRSDIGLNKFIILNLMYRIFGNRKANRILSSKPNSHLISMTNVGILDSAKLALGKLRPHDAFLCGSIKYKPHFQLAMSSYEDELTFSVNLYGSICDKDRILSFFDKIEAELPGGA